MRDLMSTKTYIQVVSIAALLVGGYFQTHRPGVDVEIVHADSNYWSERDNRTGLLRTCSIYDDIDGFRGPPKCSVWGDGR